MKNRILILTASLSIVLTFAACKTPQQTQQVMDIVTTLADTGMETYVQVALAGEVTTNQRDQIEQRLLAYRSAMNVARTAYAAYVNNPNNYPAAMKALTALSSARMELVDLILSLKKIQSKTK